MNPADNQQNNSTNAFPVSDSFTPTQQDSSQTSTPAVATPPTQTDTNFAADPQAPPMYPGETTVTNDTQSGSSNAGGNTGGAKKVLAVFGIFLMVLGIGAGVYLMGRDPSAPASAWNCSAYTFSVADNGTVTVANSSAGSEPPQNANVYINNTLVDTFSVPELASGEGATIGSVSLPSGSYTWKVEGTEDCSNSGSKEASGLSAQCLNIKVYDDNWQMIAASDLSSLKPGDVIRFSVGGTATSGSFDMARFSINGEEAVEVDDKRPGSDEYYIEYTIPSDEDEFSISAQLHHSEAGWF